MSNIFKRPMFRKGGEVGGGIMTGIRNNFQEGTPKPSERIKEVLSQYSQPAIDPVAQLLIQGGLRGMSTAGKGGTLANLASAFQEPTAQLFQNIQKQKELEKQTALAGLEMDIGQERFEEKRKQELEDITRKENFDLNIENEKNRIKQLEIQAIQAEGDADRQNKINVEIQKGKNKIAELEFKRDNPDVSVGQQVTPAFENVVATLTETYQESKNPAVKASPNLTAFNVTKFRREASPQVISKYKGFKPYTFDRQGKVIALPTDQYQAGDIIYDPVSSDFLIFDNAGGTYRLDPLTFEIQE